MEIQIRQKAGAWACKVDGVIHALGLSMSTIKLIHVVTVLKRRHPDATLELDDDIGKANPFIKYFRDKSKALGLGIDWERMSKALETPLPLTCTRCGGPCWFDLSLQYHHCLKCNGKGPWIMSNLPYEPPATGWGDDAATYEKPTEPCRNGHHNPGWYKHDSRWLCRDCGEFYPKQKMEEIPF